MKYELQRFILLIRINKVTITVLLLTYNETIFFFNNEAFKHPLNKSQIFYYYIKKYQLNTLLYLFYINVIVYNIILTSFDVIQHP